MTSETQKHDAPAAARAADSAPELSIFSPVSGALERTRPVTPAGALPEVMARARAAQRQWAQVPMRERKRALLAFVGHLSAHAERAAEHIHRYNGKTIDEAMLSEVMPTLSTFQYFAKCAHKHLRPRRIALAAMPVAHSVLHYEPLGVVGVIAPWNFPFKIMLQDVPAALMAGNAVVIKVSEHSVAIGELAEELLAGAGLPAGLVQVIYGFGDLGQALIEGGVDKIVFTGSTATGRRVNEAAARRMIPCALELGGKDAAVVLADADLDDAARGILWAGLCNSGQTCASVEMVWVPNARKQALLDRLGSLMRALPRGTVGAMNVPFQADKVRAQLDQACARGAEVVAESEQGDPGPFRVNPVLVTDVPADCDLYREETFGPVITVCGYDDLDAAIEAINDSPYGLTASVWTADRAGGVELARRIDTGAVTVNEHMLTPGLPEAPWLGHKQSGLGFSMSHLSLQAFSKLKYVYHDRGLVRFKFWRYPYTEDKRAWLRAFFRAQFGRTLLARAGGALKSLPRVFTGRNPEL